MEKRGRVGLRFPVKEFPFFGEVIGLIFSGLQQGYRYFYLKAIHNFVFRIFPLHWFAGQASALKHLSGRPLTRI